MNAEREFFYDLPAEDYRMDINVDHDEQQRQLLSLPVEAWQSTYKQPNNAVQEQYLPLYSRVTPDNNFSRVSPVASSVDHDDQQRQLLSLPVEAWQSSYRQPNNAVQEQCLPLYSRVTPDNNFSRVLPVGSSVEKRCPVCSSLSNLSCNSDEDPYRHASAEALNRVLRHSSFSPYNPQPTCNLRTTQVSNTIETNLLGGGVYDAFTTQNTEDLQMYLANTMFFPIDNTQHNGQQNSNFLERSSNAAISGSTKESAATPMTNSQSLYFPYEHTTYSAANNQQHTNFLEYSTNAVSNSLTEECTATSMMDSQSFYSSYELPIYSAGNGQHYPNSLDNSSSTFSSGSTDKSAVISMINSPYEHPIFSTVSDQVFFCSSNNSAYLEENRFENSCINEEQCSPMSSSNFNETSLVVPSSDSSFEVSLTNNSALKDVMLCCSTLYKKAVRELFSASSGLSYIHEQYACNESTKTSTATDEVVTQQSIPVENIDKLSTGLFCNFCYTNEEPEFIFRSHQLQNERRIVTCPVLRKYVCPICGASGDFAHTLRYCPLAQKNNAKNTNCQEVPQFKELECISGSNNPPSHHSTPKSTSKRLPSFSTFLSARGVQFEDANNSSLDYGRCFPFELISTSKNVVAQMDQLRTALDENTTSTSGSEAKKSEICKFCLKNDQPQDICSSHKLRHKSGVAECPFLRSYICEVCGATGDTAHTGKYCPENTKI